MKRTEDGKDRHEAKVHLAVCGRSAASQQGDLPTVAQATLVAPFAEQQLNLQSLSSSSGVKMRAGTLTASGCSLAPNDDADSTCSA